MIVTLVIKLYCPNNLEGLTYSKTYESSAVPRIGDKVKDSFFAELKQVINVVHDLKNSTVEVELLSKELKNDAFGGHIQEVAAMHEWVLVE